MSERIFQLNSFFESNGELSPCEVYIENPVKSQDGDFFSTVVDKPILKDPKQIFGFDEFQAKSLALDFIKRIAEKHPIFDESKVLIDLNHWPE